MKGRLFPTYEYRLLIRHRPHNQSPESALAGEDDEGFDIVGLIVIMAGLMLYRFSAGPPMELDESASLTSRNNEESNDADPNASELGAGDHLEMGLREPLLQHGDI